MFLMSLHNTVINISYFIETVLKTATLDSRWTPISFKYALKWAMHCEMVVKSAREKNLKWLLELDNCFQEILKTLPNKLIFEANIGFLYHAIQILLVIFLNNQKIPLKVLLMTIDIYEQHKKDHEQVMLHLGNMKCEKLSATVKKVQRDAAPMDTWNYLGGTLLLKYFCRNREVILTEETLVLFLDGEHRLRVLLAAMSIKDLYLSELARTVQTFLRDWLCQKLLEKDNHPIPEMVWHQPHQVLVSFASRHSPFFQIYIQRLFQAGDSMEPIYLDNTYKWKESKFESISFEDLRIHFKLLLDVGGFVSENTKKQISSRCLRDGCSVWEDLQMCCIDLV